MPTLVSIPNLAGKLALITGASDGIGLEIASRLASAGAELILPVRNTRKGEAAADRLRREFPGAQISVRALDLSSLSSIAKLADHLLRDGRPINLLINNAGVMTPPSRQTTQDGFELQLGTNHLGHFALVAQILPLLTAGKARVTSQISFAANYHAVNWEDPNWEHSYNGSKAYSSSKIVQGLFAIELQRRSDTAGWGIRSTFSHPGISPTNLLAAQPTMGRTKDTMTVKMVRTFSRLGIIVGTRESAAQPALLAATDPQAAGGSFYGPKGFMHLGGAAATQPIYSRLTSEVDACRAWDLSERLTRMSFPVTSSPAEWH
ncbi:short chain dehydrogenase [Rhodococcus sp. 05-340-1]|uniref:SDR family oxidoreductase n=1 Tax=Nocardiaceae TaxID=85025 RepID=UPI00050BDA30|nr:MULTISPECIES: SDR family oxidoreductase [Rhodococcus]OZC87677.1 short chain dehydrogenase [Rhodococcus sp. 06-412-2C]OZC96328.1 short chain dehydrogenase [Rhodococcus sp. 06-412-2B]OZD65311.1 short chain dehydrogenase [Rhodococcus sp. 05-340-2]OZD74642.1 short chain dehydrogenase [Rhodococcus sp. 05-340-1]OZD86584.1 short chain dehydrogenase [Rhodococcus sp. 05-339-2]